MDLTNKEELLSYLKTNGLWAKHGLGQNFLVSREILDSIITAAELKPDDLIIEIGSGVGTLTKELIQHAGKVIAVELDEKLAGLLSAVIPTEVEGSSDSKISPTTSWGRNDKLAVVNADILKLNIPELVGGKKYKVVANIPYYITSKILQLFLTLENKPETIVILVQKEVAERICAKAGDMSTLAISVQAYGEPEIIQTVPKESFFPVPKVDSAILKIKNIRSFCYSERSEESQRSFANAQDDARLEKEFFRIVHMGFASRRKTLANNLSAGLHIDKKAAAGIIERSGLNENVRAQELSVEQWRKLAGKINC